MSRPINIGIVGYGYWGPNLVRNFKSLKGCTVKLVCDPNPKRLAHLHELYPDIETYSDFNLMLKDGDVEALAIATPVHLHYSLAKTALEAGKHTFIEKPMASSVAECRSLCAIAKQRDLTLMIGHTFLYSSPVRKIKEIVDSQELGDLCYISSRRLNLGLFQKDINVVWDLAPHDLSIIAYLMNKWPSAVNCHGKGNLNQATEDIANLTLFFDKAGFAMVHSSWLDPRKVREMTIVGTKKMLVYDDLEPLQKIRIYDQHVDAPPHYDTFGEFQYSYHYGDMVAPHLKQEEPLKVECQHFLDCILDRKSPFSNGYQGLQVVAILESASESIKHGGERINLPADLASTTFSEFQG
jgi:predicted dehydrogenase